MANGLGEYVKSTQSYLEPPVIEKICRHLGVELIETEPPSRTVDNTPGARSTTTSGGLSVPKPAQRRNNHPLMTPAERPRDDNNDRTGWATPAPRPRLRPDEPETYTSESAGLRPDFADATRQRPAPAWEPHEWRLYGIDESEQMIWMDAGLASHQAKIAAACMEAKISTHDLLTVVNGWTVLNRLRSGEGAAGVARLLQKARHTGEGVG